MEMKEMNKKHHNAIVEEVAKKFKSHVMLASTFPDKKIVDTVIKQIGDFTTELFIKDYNKRGNFREALVDNYEYLQNQFIDVFDKVMEKLNIKGDYLDIYINQIGDLGYADNFEYILRKEKMANYKYKVNYYHNGNEVLDKIVTLENATWHESFEKMQEILKTSKRKTTFVDIFSDHERYTEKRKFDENLNEVSENPVYALVETVTKRF